MAFRKLILDFERQCPARGRGKPRTKFGFAALIEEWKAESKMENSKKRKMMDYIDFTVYMTTKRLKSAEQSDKLWFLYMDDPNVKKDKEGTDADGNPDWRVEVAKGDYRLETEALTHGKRMELEIQRKRAPNEQVVDGMFDQVTTRHMDFDHAYFREFGAGKSLKDDLPEAYTTPKKRSSEASAEDELDSAPRKTASATALANARTSACSAVTTAIADEAQQWSSAITDGAELVDQVRKDGLDQTYTFQLKVAQVSGAGADSPCPGAPLGRGAGRCTSPKMG